MIRLLLRLFGITDFDVCKSCETLKQQLEFERSEKKQLTQTLLNIISPKVVETPIVEMNPISLTSGNFARRRSALEAKDRAEAQILREGKHLGKPDNLVEVRRTITNELEELEKELGIEEKKEA